MYGTIDNKGLGTSSQNLKCHLLLKKKKIFIFKTDNFQYDSFFSVASVCML